MKILEDVDKSVLCKVSNTSGSDIVIALPIGDKESQSAGSTLSHDRNLEILPVSKGGFTIKNNDSDTVTLNRTFKTSKGETLKETDYQLLVSTNDWLVPVANLGVEQEWDDDDNDFFSDQVVTAEHKKAIKQTVTFYQTIAAYPDSQLAKDYVNAMTQATNDASSRADGSDNSAQAVKTSLDESVSAFFKKTKNYQNVTLDLIYVLENYYSLFPFAWAQFKNEVSYFLYSSNGSKTSFQGTLHLVKSGAVDITAANGGFTCEFIPAVDSSDLSSTNVDSSKSKKLSYQKGIFVDDTDSDIPAIALMGLFQLKQTFTNVSTDTNVIAVITGTINGQVTIGFDESQAKDPNDSTMEWLNSLFHPKTAEGIYNSVMQILGVIMMIHFIGGLVLSFGKWVREKITGKKPLSLEDMQKQMMELQKANKADLEAMFKKLSQNKFKDLPEDSVAALERAFKEQALLEGQIWRLNANEHMSRMNRGLGELELYGGSNSDFNIRINEASARLRSVHEKLVTTAVDQLKQVIADEVMPQLKTLTDTVSKLSVDVAQSVKQELKANAEENVQNMNEVKEKVEDEQKAADEKEQERANEDLEANPLELGDQ